MKTNIAPSPWHTTAQETSRMVETVRDKDGRWVCDCAFGNGNSIAAVPELIVALQHLVSSMWQHFEYHHDGEDDCGSDSCQIAVDEARAALRKAGVE